MYKKPLSYVKNSIRQILCEFTVYKDSLEEKDNKLDINELINFIEENLLNKVEVNKIQEKQDKSNVKQVKNMK
ncbi:hypothetical protein [Clostridium sp. VAP23]|uniref:hypothetical protein n=1 Tax=Clostridium sp. VAP23 TaxID=2949981 RepID=UPI0020794BBA|nr:hypothetical protein [Clostridium sp. VAP23]